MPRLPVALGEVVQHGRPEELVGRQRLDRRVHQMGDGVGRRVDVAAGVLGHRHRLAVVAVPRMRDGRIDDQMRVGRILRHPPLEPGSQIDGGHRVQQFGQLLNTIHGTPPQCVAVLSYAGSQLCRNPGTVKISRLRLAMSQTAKPGADRYRILLVYVFYLVQAIGIAIVYGSLSGWVGVAVGTAFLLGLVWLVAFTARRFPRLTIAEVGNTRIEATAGSGGGFSRKARIAVFIVCAAVFSLGVILQAIELLQNYVDQRLRRGA